MHIFFVGILLFVFNALSAGVVTQTLYINKGELMLVDSTTIPYMAFNTSPVFNAKNAVISVNSLSDTLEVKIYNNDTTKHGFEVKGFVSSARTIDVGDSAVVLLSFVSEGAFIYYDNYLYPKFRYMGLAGMIKVKVNSFTSFEWNIKEHQDDWNSKLDTGGLVNWSTYMPNYFTINGNSNPHINTDSTARIKGGVGDTLLVYIANTGQSVHSIHLHGYHAKVVYSSKSSVEVGRSKDTFAVWSMETMVLEIIPDKPGEYPVHDHNLSAVSGGNYYPNGMLLTMLIQ